MVESNDWEKQYDLVENMGQTPTWGIDLKPINQCLGWNKGDKREVQFPPKIWRKTMGGTKLCIGSDLVQSGGSIVSTVELCMEDAM